MLCGSGTGWKWFLEMPRAVATSFPKLAGHQVVKIPVNSQGRLDYGRFPPSLG